jgi:hypothetical protein
MPLSTHRIERDHGDIRNETLEPLLVYGTPRGSIDAADPVLKLVYYGSG